MRKVYQMLVVLTALLLGTAGAFAQHRVELEDVMFKAWDGDQPGANVVDEPEQVDGNDFVCENLLYQEVGAGSTVWGSNKVYYLWYADLTGTKTIHFTGTKGVQLRILMNRPPMPEDGTDTHGGTTLERNVTIGDDGTISLDVSDLKYVHLNAIKTGWGSPKGKITKIEIEGSIEGSGVEHTPMELMSAGFQNDVIRINVSPFTNLKTLMGNMERLIYPNDCVSVKVNGEPTTLLSVEGMDNAIFAFIDEGYPEDEDAKVEVSFKNPTDAKLHLKFVDGRFEGQDVPSFTDLEAKFQDGLGDYYSYLAAVPQLVSADPENGSFNLPVDLKEFKFVFSANVDCDEIKATLGNEVLKPTPAGGFSKEVTFTRSGGDLKPGKYTLNVTHIKPEMNFLDDEGELELTLGFGEQEIDPNDQPKDLVPVTYFTDCANGGIPEGFIVNFNGDERTAGNSYGSGPRMMNFDNGIDFKKGLYFREGYTEYGNADEHQLELEADKTYKISFNSAMWKDNGTWMKFEIVNEDGDAVFEEMVENTLNVNGDQGFAVKESTAKEYTFVPEADGNYVLRWTATNSAGEQGWSEVLLANVLVKYVPDVMGIEETLLLQKALENAKKVLEESNSERYAGAAFTALDNKIKEYDGKKMTAPSAFKKAAEELDAAAKAMQDHHLLCDTYDPLPGQAQEIVDNFADSKFSGTSYYKAAVDVAKKYADKTLFDDAELTAAIDELSSAINKAKAMFTYGPSKASMTGYAVLTERLRLGAETLKSLGVAEDDYLVDAANKELTDNDDLVEQIKTRIKVELYGQLKNADNTLFEEIINEETLETTTPTYDMTVFVKNPNIYRVKKTGTFNPEAVPGWEANGNNPGLTHGWGDDPGTDEIPVDAMFSNWGGSFNIGQTIEDLPAGVYTIDIVVGERMDEASLEGSYAFIATTAEPDSVMQDITVIGQSYPQVGNNGNVLFEDVAIADGKLTLGFNAGPNSHVFFNEVRVLMSGPAAGFNYTMAYESALTPVEETIAKPATVRALELYDLNGQRITSARRGIVVVKKLMSDGTVRTEKVMK